MFVVCQNGKNVSPHQHIGLPYHWLRGKVSSLEIEIHNVSSDDQLADQFTKGLCRESLRKQGFLCWGGELCSVFEREIQEKRTVKLCSVVERESQEK